MTRYRNPVVGSREDGFYATLPRRYSWRGGAWWLGPYKRRHNAEIVAGFAQRGFSRVQVLRPEGQSSLYVGIAGGWRLAGPAVIGPFDTRREAAGALAKLLPADWQPPTPAVRSGAIPKVSPEVSKPQNRIVGEIGTEPPPRPAATTPATADSALQEAVGALRGLDYNKADAIMAVQRARVTLGPSAGTEALIRAVFKEAKQQEAIASNPLMSSMEKARARAGAWTYVKNIRNKRKQDYALFYFGHLTEGMDVPKRPPGLSLMAAQAVEIRLRELMSGRAPNPTSEPCPACGYALRLPKRARSVTCRRCGAMSKLA